MSISRGGFTAIVDTLVYLAAPFIPLLIAFVFRKRVVAWFSRQLAASIVAWAFVTKEVEGEDGKIVEIKAVSEPARGLLAAAVPALVAEVAKSVKLKVPAGGVGLPAGLDLSNLSEALPAILGSGMIPKKYAGLVALAAPFLQGFLSGQKPGAKAPTGKPGDNPFLKELGP